MQNLILTISYKKKHLFFVVFVFCVHIYTVLLVLRPDIGLMYVVSIVNFSKRNVLMF